MTYKEGKPRDDVLKEVMYFLRTQQMHGLPVRRASPVALGQNAVPVQAHFSTETLSLLRRCSLYGTERSNARVSGVGVVASIGTRSCRFGDGDAACTSF